MATARGTDIHLQRPQGCGERSDPESEVDAREEGEGRDEASIPCFRCGICCTRYDVRITWLEARRVADGLGLTWEEWLDGGYVEKRWDSHSSFLLRRYDGACVFLEYVPGRKMTRCTIHPFKPAACLEWNPSLKRRECLEGLAGNWGLRVSSSGHIEGPAQALRDFNTSLRYPPP